MPVKILCLLWLAATLNVTGAVAQDEDSPIGFKVIPTAGLVTSEAGRIATFTVVLKSQPTADVTIELASSDASEGVVALPCRNSSEGTAAVPCSNTSEEIVDPDTLIFTTSNWNTAQTVSVIGVDDLLVDGDIAYTIVTAAARSADLRYDDLDPDNVAVINTDNDRAGTAKSPAKGTNKGTPPPGGIRISITNEYEVEINFGPLGKGWRKGTDVAKGVIRRQGSDYAGSVTASVASDQAVIGFMLGCGPARYEDSQELKVIGHPVDGFNPLVQSVAPATMTGQASNEYLGLEFIPETMTSQQPGPRLPEDMHPDLNISCHTLIDTLSGIAFLPLNDSRWTMEGPGYVIRLPTSGTLNYTDNTVPTAGGAQLGPFNAKKSVWTIQVERLP
jgi:hypothetical protein